MIARSCWCVLLLLAQSMFAVMQAFADPILTDRNGDGQVVILGFGDSLTFGVGDGVAPGVDVEVPPRTDGRQGYPLRIESTIGVPVENRGVPGEEIQEGGIERLPSVVGSSNADFVIFFEGLNDTIVRLDTGEYSRLVQQSINVIRALGKEPILVTLPTPCCQHAGREPFVAGFSQAIRDLAGVNDLSTVDLEKAWFTTCVNKSECELFNLPEGLHPNTRGYDVIGQMMIGVLYGIDLLIPGSAAELESTLGLAEGSIIVQPEAGLPPPVETPADVSAEVVS